MSVGKRIGSSVYIHLSAVDSLQPTVLDLLKTATESLEDYEEKSFNVVKADAESFRVSFLHYANFEDDPFPALSRATSVDLKAGSARTRDYSRSKNPPILHRKELLVSPDYPKREVLDGLTEKLDALGLYAESHKIGHRRQWAARLAAADVGILDHCVVKLSTTLELSEDKPW